MSRPITIGLELELLFAFIPEEVKDTRTTTPPSEGSENRTHVFSRRPEDPIGVVHPGAGMPYTYMMSSRIKGHVARTIDAGKRFAIDMTKIGAVDPDVWQIDNDRTIKPPRPEVGSPWRHIGVEIKSPALVFSQSSLEEIKAMCLLLTSRYHVSANKSCGFHLHIGHHNHGFNPQTKDLQKLVAFLYTFEPQINTLHPPHRLNHTWGDGMRDNCKFQRTFRMDHPGEEPKASDFGRFVIKQENASVVWDAASNMGADKTGDYNFGGLKPRRNWTMRTRLDRDMPEMNESLRKTIEFRQHAGTIDAEAITHWVQVIVGIVHFCEDGDPTDYFKLLTTAWRAEEWQKLGDGEDKERETEFGPVLADQGFTIVNLLWHIGCREQAKYYNTRWRRHDVDDDE